MFTELTKPANDVKMEKTCYGTISVVDGTRYVKLDGSDLLVPAASTVKTSHGDRVTVLMKNHSLTVTGNLTAPATDGEGGSSGEAGTAATIEIGTVTTGEAGSSASVINSGTTSAAVFDFVIPRGDKGEKGDTGPQGPQGEKGDTGTWDGTIPDHEHTVSDITDFPTSLPANGGNADTLDGKHAIDFFNNIAGLISPETSGKATLVEYINTLDSATSNFYASEFDDLPTNNWGYNVTVYKAGGAVYVIAYKALSNREIYVRNFTVSGEWNGDWTRLNDGGNADTVDGKHAESFMQWLGILDYTDFMNDANHKVDYHCNIIDGTLIGLPMANWYHIVYYMHSYSNGYGMQIAYPLSFDGATMIRRSNGTTWTNWKNVADGGNADTVDGLHESDLIYARGYLNGIDLDDIKYPCSALALNCINRPPVDVWGTLLVYAGGTGSFTQIYIPTADDGTPTTMYFRHHGTTGWTTWRNAADGGNAASVGAYTEAKLAELEARIAALERGAT